MEEIFSRKITEEDIKKINEIKPKFISIRSTKCIDRTILSKLDNSIRIRIVGEDEVKQEQEKSVIQGKDALEEFGETFSKSELDQILMLYQEYESGIHDDWSDLTKAVYIYARMIAEYDVATEKELSVESDSLKSFYTFNPSSKGLAKNYKELMDRVGILCNYVENSDKNYAWNEINFEDELYPVDLAMDTKNSHANGVGNILIHNFGKNPEFYSYPEHKLEENKKIAKTLDKGLVEEALDKAVEQIVLEKNNKTEFVRADVKIPIHSKELEEVFKEGFVSLKDVEEQKPLKISVVDNDIGELKTELKEIATYYPEILDNVEIENISSAPLNMQEVVDTVYESRTIGENLVIDPVNITIASKFEEDFKLDLSNVPEIAESTSSKVDDMPSGQQISFKNTDTTKQLKAPEFVSKISDNVSGMSFEGFDLTGLDLRNTNITNLSFVSSTNLNSIEVGTNVSFAIELEAVTETELNSALTNFAIHNLKLKHVNLRDRAILQELSANPELVKISIIDSSLNNLDGLEDFDKRLYLLNVQDNDLSVDDIERVENFRKTNPYFESYLNQNSKISNAIRRTPNISDDSYNFIKHYNDQINIKFKVTSKNSAVEYMLWDGINIPYYIQDAKTIRDILKITPNPMMVKDNAELDTFDFTQSYLRDGTLLLTPAQVEHLISINKSVPQNVRLYIESAADLTVDYTNDLTSRANAIGIRINEVQIFDKNKHNNHEHIVPYKLNEYIYIRDTLDIITSGINASDSDIDKFATIYQRLMDSITYDTDAVKSDNANEAKIYAEKRSSSRNLLEGLVEGKCVCSGYADILRNALMIVGIEGESLSGFTKRDSSGNEAGFHSWNMVKLDDGTGTKKWYYTDLTWAAGATSMAQKEQYILRGNSADFTSRHMPWSANLPNASQTDFDIAVLRKAFNKAKTKSFNVRNKQNEINIPNDPELEIEILDSDRILAEYNRRKNDMCAKFYGDKSYKKEYMERSRRFRSHEIEESAGSITYRKIEDYPEKEEDEQFLLLDQYSKCLERVTRYEAGDTSVYRGNSAQIKKALEKDKEYVETRNHTFNKNQNMRSNLATLGKFGERVPYIPKQPGVLRNVGRVALNSGILLRNGVAPIYRGIGTYIAQPIHKLVVGNKEKSPFDNNWYHRMVARRNYFTEKNNNVAPGHAIRNEMKARLDAIFKAKEGNEAVLNAGAYDIRLNVIDQEKERVLLDSLNNQSAAFKSQIQYLQDKMAQNPSASNIDQVKKALQEKLDKKAKIDKKINNINQNRIGTTQTDAISDAEHDIAVKEEVTLKTTVIKGFAKGLAVKYVGPKIHTWLEQKGTKTVTDTVTTTTKVQKEKWVDPTYKVEETPITEMQLNRDNMMSDIISSNSGREVKGFRTVWGGEKGEITSTIKGNENITAIFQKADGVGGVGLSDTYGLKAPVFTDGTFASEFLDANGLLRQDITVDQILNAIGNGAIKPEDLSNVYVSVGDRYWTKLSDLTTDLIKEVEVGKKLEKVIDVAGHYETYFEDVPQITTVTHTIVNDKLVKATNIASKAFKGGVIADSALDLEENLRFTNTQVKNNKRNPRNYGFVSPDVMPKNRKEFKEQIERERDS